MKVYLQGLAENRQVPVSGVRELQTAFHHVPQEGKPDGPPWLVGGKWVYTRDGKPRQPGALRKPGKSGDLPETTDWLIEAMEHWDEADFDPLP